MVPCHIAGHHDHDAWSWAPLVHNIRSGLQAPFGTQIATLNLHTQAHLRPSPTLTATSCSTVQLIPCEAGLQSRGITRENTPKHMSCSQLLPARPWPAVCKMLQDMRRQLQNLSQVTPLVTPCYTARRPTGLRCTVWGQRDSWLQRVCCTQADSTYTQTHKHTNLLFARTGSPL